MSKTVFDLDSKAGLIGRELRLAAASGLGIRGERGGGL